MRFATKTPNQRDARVRAVMRLILREERCFIAGL